MSNSVGSENDDQHTTFGEQHATSTAIDQDGTQFGDLHANRMLEKPDEGTIFGEPAAPPPSAGRAVSANLDLRLTPGDIVVSGQYIIDQAVQSGREADAYLGHDAFDPTVCVFIKHFRHHRADQHFVEKKAELRERMLGIAHPNCAKMLSTEISLERVIEVFEFIDGGSLADYLRTNPRPSDEFIRDALRQLADGLFYLQSTLGVAHRDIKPDNVLIAHGTRPTFKITDYGTITAIDAGGVTNTEFTPLYAPPEALRRSLRRDTDLMAFDWWSLGRIIQEMADGMHVFEKLRRNYAKDAPNLESARVIFSMIMSEQERHTYSERAGLVEWSSEKWRPVLRGLLTSKRQLRWGHARVIDWLEGRPTTDAYDAPPDIEPFRYNDIAYDGPNAALALAQSKAWPEAVGWVIEGKGIIAYLRNLGDQRLMLRIEAGASLYPVLAKYSIKAAEDLTTAMVLAIIGAPLPMALTMRGEVCSQATIEQAIAQSDRGLLNAFIDSKFLLQLSTLTGPKNTEFFELLTRLAAIAAYLSETKVQAFRTNDRILRVFTYGLLSTKARNEAFSVYQSELAGSTDTKLNAVFTNFSQSTPIEQAALLFILQDDSAHFGFMTHIQNERSDVEKLKNSQARMRHLFALITLRPVIFIHDSVSGSPKTSAIRSMLLAACVVLARYHSSMDWPDIGSLFVTSALVIFGLLFGLRGILGYSIRSYGKKYLGMVGATPSARDYRSMVRQNVPSGRPFRDLQLVAGELASVKHRLADLRQRHSDLRTSSRPLPFIGFGAIAVIIALYMVVPLGIGKALAANYRSANLVSDRNLAERVTAAYFHGRIGATDRYLQEPARSYLENTNRLTHFSSSLRSFGAFREIRSDGPWINLPGHATFLVIFARCQFHEELTREQNMITGFLFKDWRPYTVGGCAGRETSTL